MSTERVGVKPRALLLLGQIGERQFHNTPDHWSHLARIMRSVDLDARVMTDDLGAFNPVTLANFDVILNYSTDLVATDEQMEALLGAIRQGIGFVGLHAATATFRASKPYQEMIGSRFVRHPPIMHFTVEITDSDHPITRGMSSFEIEDERYELGDVADGLRILANAEGFPMIYATEYGAGRVCYLAPGHDHRTLSRPEYQQLVAQAIDWAARKRA